MQMILGLAPADVAAVTVNGMPFAGLSSAIREVSALLDATAILGLRDPPQRSARDVDQMGTQGRGCGPHVEGKGRRSGGGSRLWAMAQAREATVGALGGHRWPADPGSVFSFDHEEEGAADHVGQL
jgi:hypothetical protein